jgi:hypothetical protein
MLVEDLNRALAGYTIKRLVVRKWLLSLGCHRITMMQPRVSAGIESCFQAQSEFVLHSGNHRGIPTEDQSERDPYGRPLIRGVRLEVDPEQARVVRRAFDPGIRSGLPRAGITA